VRSLPHTKQLASPGSTGALQVGQVVRPASGVAPAGTADAPATPGGPGSGAPGGTAMVGAPGSTSAAGGVCGGRAAAHGLGGDAAAPATSRSPQFPQKRSPG